MATVARPSPPPTSPARGTAVADVARHTPVLAVGDADRALRRRRRAQGREPAAHGRRSRSAARWPSSPRSGDGCARRRRRAGARATTPRRSPWPRACAACRARSSCPPERADRQGGGRRRARRDGPPRRATSVDECVAAALERAQEAGHGLRAPVRRPRRRRGAGDARARAARRTCRTWRGSSSPSAAAGWPAASRSRSSPRGPDVEVVGVQVETVAAYPASLRAGAPVAVDGALTIADGIAVKRPGELTLRARARVARRRRGRGRGRRRRGDGAPAREGQARGRGRRRRGRRGAARRRRGARGRAGRRA